MSKHWSHAKGPGHLDQTARPPGQAHPPALPPSGMFVLSAKDGFQLRFENLNNPVQF